MLSDTQDFPEEATREELYTATLTITSNKDPKSPSVVRITYEPAIHTELLLSESPAAYALMLDVYRTKFEPMDPFDITYESGGVH